MIHSDLTNGLVHTTAKLLLIGAISFFSMPAAPQTANDQRVIGMLRSLNTAQLTYIGQYPKTGYACTLAQLGPGAEGTKHSKQHANLIPKELVSGSYAGYEVRLSCDGKKYRIIAVPKEPGGQVYCIDESALVRTSDRADTCLTAGGPPKPPKQEVPTKASQPAG
jgi:hypothetical protein